MPQGQYTTSELRQLTTEDLRSFLGSRSSRRLCNNTTVERGEDGDIAVRLHATRVLVFHADDSFTVDSGGWHSTTTKQRLNALMPAGYRVFAKSYAWYLDTPQGTFPFEDGDRWGQPQHVAEWVEEDGRYVARCSCGWAGEPSISPSKASSDASWHETLAA